MSDKNKNMNDIDNQKTAEQQAFSEEIRRRLAQPGSGKPTLDEFKVMVYKDREKRRKKRNALVACIVAAFIVGYLTYDDLVPEVGADKNPKETLQIEDGIIIEDGGWGSSISEGEKTIISKWDSIWRIKEKCPKLKVPKYIPKSYEFNKLVLEHLGNDDLLCEYFFTNEKEETIEIEQVYIKGGEVTLSISESDKQIKCSKGIIYFQEENIKAIISFDDGSIITIWHCLSEKQLIKIIESME